MPSAVAIAPAAASDAFERSGGGRGGGGRGELGGGWTAPASSSVTTAPSRVGVLTWRTCALTWSSDQPLIRTSLTAIRKQPAVTPSAAAGPSGCTERTTGRPDCVAVSIARAMPSEGCCALNRSLCVLRGPSAVAFANLLSSIACCKEVANVLEGEDGKGWVSAAVEEADGVSGANWPTPLGPEASGSSDAADFLAARFAPRCQESCRPTILDEAVFSTASAVETGSVVGEGCRAPVVAASVGGAVESAGLCDARFAPRCQESCLATRRITTGTGAGTGATGTGTGAGTGTGRQ